MELDFKLIKVAVAKQFDKLSKRGLYRTAVPKDDLWACYLASFPAGTNPIYKEKTEHDCNCCKSFVRAVGNAVAIIDGKVVSVWDCVVDDSSYQAVVDALAKLAKSHPIANPFLHFEGVAGADRTLVAALDSGVSSWSHFFVNIPKQYALPGEDIAEALGKKRANFDVMKRGLQTITKESVDTALELIAQNSLYRGEEHKTNVQAFRNLQSRIQPATDIDTFVWANLTPVGMIRNTAIGTLLVDLSEGVGMDQAVGSFEAKVAPQNYKRPTALVTKAMIEKAKATITELGLSSALERRYATLEDITINNILYANRNAKRKMNADVFDALAAKVPVKLKGLEKIEDVPIEVFLREILPRAEGVELLVENRHSSNFMSLVAAADPTAKKLFKWDNGFSWSYNGDVADSIKERVKQAGGNVTGDFCCRLAWFNHDDLDLHLREPNGNVINFYTKGPSNFGGRLDVDMHVGRGTTRTPVENIFYGSHTKMEPGVYTLMVNQYNQREMTDVGFEVEVDWLGTIWHFAYPEAVRNKATIEVAKFKYDGKDLKVISSLPFTQAGRELWGITTQTFQPVNVIMASPNHWDGQGVGNKHWFFMLESCRNDGQARGFYNEFLTEELTAHRKVIELIGARMRTEESDRQLSGLGFSSTQRNNVHCRVAGSFSRVINLVF